mmetsp:Transcript_40862/g.128038  ORF Transcript_40862/g.128038 Transcript_40862/m.128038 type:complete len:516 (+) Transcript_40862:992-2539(+)
MPPPVGRGGGRSTSSSLYGLSVSLSLRPWASNSSSSSMMTSANALKKSPSCSRPVLTKALRSEVIIVSLPPPTLATVAFAAILSLSTSPSEPKPRGVSWIWLLSALSTSPTIPPPGARDVALRVRRSGGLTAPARCRTRSPASVTLSSRAAAAASPSVFFSSSSRLKPLALAGLGVEMRYSFGCVPASTQMTAPFLFMRRTQSLSRASGWFARSVQSFRRCSTLSRRCRFSSSPASTMPQSSKDACAPTGAGGSEARRDEIAAATDAWCASSKATARSMRLVLSPMIRTDTAATRRAALTSSMSRAAAMCDASPPASSEAPMLAWMTAEMPVMTMVPMRASSKSHFCCTRWLSLRPFADWMDKFDGFTTAATGGAPGFSRSMLVVSVFTSPASAVASWEAAPTALRRPGFFQRCSGPRRRVSAVRKTLAGKTSATAKKLRPRSARTATMLSASSPPSSIAGMPSEMLLSPSDDVRPTPAVATMQSSTMSEGTTSAYHVLSVAKQRRPARDARWLS